MVKQTAGEMEGGGSNLQLHLQDIDEQNKNE